MRNAPPAPLSPRRARAAAPLRALLALAAVAVAAVAAGCGDDEGTAVSTTGDGTQPYLTVAEVREVLDRSELAIVRTGGGDTDSGREGLVDLIRYADRSGREFELFLWSTARIAQQQRAGLLRTARGQHGEDATAIRAANVIVVFPGPPSEVPAYRIAAERMSELGAACTPGGGGPERLRELCFADEGGVPPEGGGAARDEAASKAEPVVVGGLHYDPLVARRLNPAVKADSELVSGRRRPAGKVWFGVFLRVCNRGDESREAASRLALVNASGARATPTELPDDNPFAYDARTVRPGQCLPREGAVAEQVDGALVLFAVDDDFVGDFPIALEVGGDGSSESGRVLVDG